MNRVAYYRWLVPSQTPPGRTITTRYRMTEVEAQAAHGDAAQRVGEPEWRALPQTAAEIGAAATSAWQRVNEQ
jgi:hypothetical protein